MRSLCARRRMTMRRPQKNGGTEVETFFLGVARDARAGWQQLGGGTEAIAECPQLLAWLFYRRCTFELGTNAQRRRKHLNLQMHFLNAGKKTSLPPRWAARFNTRGWRLGFGCSGVVLCLSMKRCQDEQVCSSPSREAAPSERPSCRLKAFLKCV